MIDAVITWVDGTDPEHQRKRSIHMPRHRDLRSSMEQNAVLETRFAESGELRYSILLLRHFAPWLGRVHVLTDAQQPAWLTRGEAERLGVSIVDHRVIFADHESSLPTFNSLAIETLLHRIPGLAPRFIYLNDDFFVLRPVSESDYFDGNTPRLRANLQTRERRWPWGRQRWQSLSPPSPGLVGLRTARLSHLKRRRQRAVLYHAPYPVVKRDFPGVSDADISQNVQHRFRNRRQFGPLAVYANLGYDAGTSMIVESDVAYFSPQTTPEITPDLITRATEDPNTLHACFQSLDEFSPDSRAAVFAFLDSLLDA